MTNTYDKEKLYSYLLGSLPDEDIELLDELTFTDPAFADSVNIAEKDLVDSYVNGGLEGSQLENFESHYLASPIRRKNVQFARAFKDFAAREQLAGESRSARAPLVSTPGTKSGFSAFLESLRGFGFGQPIVAVAAVVPVLALIALSAWLLIGGIGRGPVGNDVALTNGQNSVNSPVNQAITTITPLPTATETASNGNGNLSNGKPTPSVTPEPKTSPKEPVEPTRPTIATFVLLPPLRGGEKLAQVSVPPQTDTAAFTIKLDSNDYASYRIDLRNTDSGRSVWQAGRVKPGGKGAQSSLGVRVPAKLLKSGIYSFAVSGIAPDDTTENIGDYAFRVVR